VRYVKTLEMAMPSLRWGALQIKGDLQPPELSLQVYVVGVQP
jgi:MSHA biogenesis protein MshJ